MAVHFFLGSEFCCAVCNRPARAAGNLPFGSSGEVGDEDLAIANARYLRAVGRQDRIERKRFGRRLHFATLACRSRDHKQSAREWNKNLAAVVRQVVSRDSSRRQTQSLALRFFLGRE